MSHESSQWSVSENLRRLELAKQAAWVAANECEWEIANLGGKIESARAKYNQSLLSLSRSPPMRPERTVSLEAVNAYVGELKAHLRETSAELAANIAAFNIGTHLSRIAGKREPSTKNAQPISSASERQSTALRIVGRLAGDVAQKDQQKIHDLADQFVRAGDKSHAANLELELRLHVQRANEAMAQRNREVERAIDWEAKLRGFQGANIAWANSELADIELGKKNLTSSLQERLLQIEAQARQESDREYVAQVIKDEFMKLGYSVEENFATAFARGGSTHLHMGGASEYAVELSVLPELNQFDARVVRHEVNDFTLERESSPRQQRDAESEAGLCKVLGKVREGMRKFRIDSRISNRVPPGQTPVAVTKVPSQKSLRPSSPGRSQTLKR